MTAFPQNIPSCTPARGKPPQRQKEDCHAQEQQSRCHVAPSGNAACARRARPIGESRLRQSAGSPCLDRALSDGRGFSGSQIALPLRSARHAKFRGPRNGTARARRTGLHRRCAVAFRSGGDLDRAPVLLQAGDHVLVTDSIYLPTRKFCDDVLKRYGIDTTYYDPMIGSDIAGLMKPNTRAVFIEAPGRSRSRSRTFRPLQLPYTPQAPWFSWITPGRARFISARWKRASPLDPGRHQIHRRTFRCDARHDLSQRRTLERVNDTVHLLGLCVGPDDMYLGLRGLRTMGVRLAQHHRSGLQVARWLASRPEIARVLHPALESCPGHSIWQRDFRRERPLQYRVQTGCGCGGKRVS